VRTHVALLRGINVQGHNKVSMADLRRLVAAMGHQHVAAYIQSGNVVFDAGDRSADEAALAHELEMAIAAEFSLRIGVVVVARDHLREVVRSNPFRQAVDPKTLHAVFFQDAFELERAHSTVAAVERARTKGSRDDARVVDAALYLWTPGGFARSLLRAELELGGKASPMRGGTARNWATVTMLESLLEE